MSVALVAVARAAREAREARPSRRVTCVRVPQRPPEAPPGPPQASSPLPEGRPAIAASCPVPPFWFEGGPPAAEPKPAPAPAPAVVVTPVVAAPEPEVVVTPPVAAPDLVLLAPASPRRDTTPAWGWSEPWSFEIPATDRTSGRERATRRTGSRRDRRPLRGRGTWRYPAIACAVLTLAIGVWAAAPWASSAGPRRSEAAPYTPHPSAFALRTIPAVYLHDYWKVAEEYGLDWTKLAAVGQIESDQGRSQTAGVTQGTNTAGAAGPAQFLGTTWARYGVDADGRGTIDPYDPTDAITAMAAYLKASGAPQNWRQALYTYNHSIPYVNAVISLSRLYLGPKPT